MVFTFLYYLLPGYWNGFLTCASYVLYGWWEPWFVLLAFFRNYPFTAGNLNRPLSVFGAGTLPMLRSVLPIRISSYTFGSTSYIIDVYRRDAPPARRYSDISCIGCIRLKNFTEGIAIFALGFAKKILLANPMGFMANTVFQKLVVREFVERDIRFGTERWKLVPLPISVRTPGHNP